MKRLALGCALAVLLAACSEPPAVRQPIPITPPQDSATAPVIRKEIPPPAPSPATAAAPMAPIVLPAGAQYVCVGDQDGLRRQTAIQFTDKVAELCRKHPEMGPCQYERDVCRRGGGRVYAANNVEITRETEAEYDRKVMRVRFKAN